MESFVNKNKNNIYVFIVIKKIYLELPIEVSCY